MKILRILGFSLLITMPLNAGAVPPVAIVYSLTGTSSLVAPNAARRPLQLFDRLPAGTALEAGPGSRVAVAFVNGLRYELAERARVTIGRKDLDSRRGPVRALPRVPPLPDLSPIAVKDRPGPRAGAVRIRQEEIDGLSPRDGAVTLASATVLSFQKASGTSSYQVEIEDVRGAVIFRVTTESSTVRVPAGILTPGIRYHWTVSTVNRPGPVMRGEADFITLSRKTAEARERLREALEASGDDDSRALLSAIDHALGLTSDAPRGVVVESVTPGSPGEAAGLRPGDVILSWPGGTIRSPFDLVPLDIEEAPRRGVTLRGKREGQDFEWTLKTTEWGIEVRPNVPDGLVGGGDDTLAAWFLSRQAKALAEAGKWPEADAAYEETLASLERESMDQAAAQLLREWGETFDRRADWNAAVDRLQKALALDRMTAPKSLAEAQTLNALGVTAAKRGDYPTAQQLLRQSLALREELAPGNAVIMGSLNNLGILARVLGDLDSAEDYLARAEALLRRLAPESSDRALAFQNLGNLAHSRGDLERAESFHRQALAIFEKTAPDGDGVADCWANLANVAIERGDFTTADDLLRRTLALRARRAPDELSTSNILISLGNLAARRGDLEEAEIYYRRALEIQAKLAPDDSLATYSLTSLGSIAMLRGDFETARMYLERSLKIQEKLSPENQFGVVAELEQLGRIETSGGHLDKAEELLQRAMVMLEKQAPRSLELSDILRNLAEIAVRRGRLAEAIALLGRALDLQSSLAPESAGEAEALHLLGRAKQQAGRSREGLQDLCRAIDVLDRQRARVGGTSEAKTAFESTLGNYYQACLEGLIQTGRPEEAFRTLERGRARSFLTLLAERDLRFADLPPELAAERRRLDAEYDRVQSQLAHEEEAGTERLTGELRDLRNRQEEIRARIRRESPRSAALQDPEPLDLAGARRVLDPGTVLLEYAVGPEASWLFVVQPSGLPGPGLSVFPIHANAKSLGEDVETFRRLLKRPGSDRTALQERARRLYDLLVRPAEARITRAQRILLSPDGPLHTLPFAALMRGNRYLVEKKPIHSVLSATVYAELTRSRPARRKPVEERLDAFGDPVYPPLAPDAPVDLEVQEAVRRGWSLKPLPSTRQEVEAIAALFPQGHAYLGPEATEEKAKSLGPEARLVHFACHGLLDERFPLNSALALTVPLQQTDGQDNGLLQAWEIFEHVHLDADLVTLSACDTALGKEMGGEGLVGLTRAFQYAGARSVLASMWGISDLSTARFMQRFYEYLRSGKPKDEALRAAQIDQIRGKSGSAHPFYWAAFELTGDWR